MSLILQPLSCCPPAPCHVVHITLARCIRLELLEGGVQSVVFVRDRKKEYRVLSLSGTGRRSTEYCLCQGQEGGVQSIVFVRDGKEEYRVFLCQGQKRGLQSIVFVRDGKEEYMVFLCQGQKRGLQSTVFVRDTREQLLSKILQFGACKN
ncbi:hypothetical protein ElyMa_006220400 [Elysia marginata]|uniref:Nucleoplasmin-like domain-containing protein n=1 Tax=Elysia marginata TaxID=1093978 RepID=A0AAV4H6S9_9GAST|nr:hypothetical protein ElyMa_006220400 [Elysia marginata]